MTAAVSISTRSSEHPGGRHVDVIVFAGEPGRTRANCGTLTLLPGEAAELVARLAAGEDSTS